MMVDFVFSTYILCGGCIGGRGGGREGGREGEVGASCMDSLVMTCASDQRFPEALCLANPPSHSAAKPPASANLII